MKNYTNKMQKEAWGGDWGSLNNQEQEEWETPIEQLKKKNHFIEGFKKGFFGTFRFMGENASVLMLFFSIIEYFRGWYVLSIHSVLVAILFAILDLKNKN